MNLRRILIGSCCATALLAGVPPVGSLRAATAVAAQEAQPLVEDAQQRIAKGDLRGAEIQLKNAARANPKDPGPHLELAKLYLKVGNLPAAEAEARLARRDGGKPDDVDPVLADTLLKQNKVNELFDQVKPDNRAPKSESHVRLDLGLMHLELRELDQAKTILTEAATLDPDAVGPKVALVRLFLASGKTADAAAELAKAQAIAPDDRGVALVQALLKRTQGDSDGAIAIYTKLLAKSPDLEALLGRAAALLDEKKFDAAEKDIDQARKSAPRNPLAVDFKAYVLASKGDLKGADDLLAGISAYFPFIPQAYFLAGAVKLALGQLQLADQDLSKYNARFPSDPAGQHLYAQAMLRERNFQGVISLLKPLIDQSTSDLVSDALLAQAYIATGEKNKAVEIYERAALAQPDNPEAQTRLAVAQLQVGDLSAGLAELEKTSATEEGIEIAGPLLILNDLRQDKISEAAATADAMVRRNANDLVAQSWLGTVLIAQQDLPAAEKIFKSILEKDPNFDSAKRRLAQIYAQTDRLADAKSIWQSFLQKDPKNIEALVALINICVSRDEFKEAAAYLQQLRNAGSGVDPRTALNVIRASLLDLNLGDPAQNLSYLRQSENTTDPFRLFGAAIVLTELRNGDITKAEALVNAMMKQDASDPEARNLLGGIRIAQGNYAQAEDIFKGILRDNPDFTLARQNLAEIYVKTGRIEDAKNVWRDLLKRSAGDTTALTALANIDVSQNDRQDAVQLLKQALPSSSDPVLGLQLMQLYSKEKDWNNALSTANALKSQFPGNADVIDAAARVEAQSGDASGAVMEYRPLVERFPNSEFLLERYAVLQTHAGDHDGARRTFVKLNTIAPGNERYMAELVAFDFDTKGLDAALSTARSFAPKEQVASDLLVADVYVRANRIEDAIAEISDAVKHHPDSRLAIRLAQMLWHVGKNSAAEDTLRTWLNSHGDDVKARATLAGMYLLANDSADALHEYEEVHRRAPGNVDALNNLAWLYTKERNPRASELARNAFDIDPNPNTADTLGWALANQGNAAQGLAYLKMASTAQPENSIFQYHLAVALDAHGEKEQARAALERALKSGASFEGREAAQQLLAQLNHS
jgi:cellulose synthase operon protein C